MGGMSGFAHKRLFKNITGEYIAYRRGYPDDVFEILEREAELCKGDWIADIGCGTGLSAIPMANKGYNISAIDPEPNMISVLEGYKIPRICGVVSTAEEYDYQSRPYRLVTAARVFHWLDRERFLKKLYNDLAPGAYVAAFWDETIAIAENDWWFKTIKPIAIKWSGYDVPLWKSDRTKTYADDIAISPFAGCKKIIIPEKRVWTQDEIIGYYLSLSWCNADILGANMQSFLDEMKVALTEIERSQPLMDHVEHTVLWLSR